MATSNYIDIFAAKDLVSGMFREVGSIPYSRLLMHTHLPEEVLDGVLNLLQKEKKISITTPVQETSDPTFQPVSGAWSLSGWRN